MSDAIRITGLRAQARVGVTEAERARPQTVVCDVDIAADLGPAAASDDISDTVDYSKAVAAISDTIETSEAHLLEHLAQKVISVVSRMDAVTSITVHISKQPPPVEQPVDAVTVRIERHFT